MSRVRGTAEIGFAVKEGRTRLAHLYQHEPLRVLFPTPAPDDLPVAALLTTSGGLVAGDHLAIRGAVGEGAAAQITASAAEKIYRSEGPDTEIAQEFSVGAGGWLEFLPPETILFDGARLRRETRLALAPGAGFLGGDLIVFGRRARGEYFSRGLLREAWEIRRCDRLVWGDALHLEGDLPALFAEAACLDGAAACATLVLAPCERPAESYVAAARAVLEESAAAGLQAGVTALSGLVVARWLARDAAFLRRSFVDLACHLRADTMGLPRRLPRFWQM